MTDRYRILKLDKRYAGSHAFRWRIDVDEKQPIQDKVILYRDMREWCQQTYGNTIEIPHHRIMYNNGQSYNQYWAFWTRADYHQFYLFLAGDQELALFRLKF